MLWVGLQCVIVVFSGHTHLLIEMDCKKKIDYTVEFRKFKVLGTRGFI